MPPSAPSDAGPASARTVRHRNRVLVLRAVADGPARSRAQLAADLGLARATVSALVEDLVARRLVQELDADRSLPGRPATPLALDPRRHGALGVEVGADHVTAVVLDLTGGVRAHGTAPLDAAGTPAAVLDEVAAAARRVVAASGRDVRHGRVALPGLLDPDGVVRHLPTMPAWDGVDAAAALGTALGLDLRADNEANLAALADLRADVAGRDFLHVSGEIGVGAALVRDGRLFRGARGAAGELGHVLVDPDGPACGCGSRGCLEQYVGQRALVAAAGVADVEDLLAALAADAPSATSALAAAGAALGRALADAVALVDPPAIVLGGLYATVFDHLAGPVRAQLLARRHGDVTVVRSPHGPDAAAVGAAVAVLDDIVSGRVGPAAEERTP